MASSGSSLLIAAVVLAAAVASPSSRQARCICNALYKPVCSTDGRTYPNTCTAACKSAPVACKGSCPCEDEGGEGGSAEGTTSTTTTTTTRPEFGGITGEEECEDCPSAYLPVCTVDGFTYPNSCKATCDGAEIDCDGECPCGGDGDYNNNDNNDDDGGDYNDNNGDFQLNDCRCEETYRPVCGQNGETYTNECYAGCKEVAVRCDGRCPCRRRPFT